MDLRCSGKDLIKNHLTMSVYNHAAIWQKKEMLPRAMFVNGYLLFNAEKMSKSKGTFLTLRDAIEKYGTDPTRFALADAGDLMDDANFAEDTANAAIMRLNVFEQWAQEQLSKINKDTILKEGNFEDIHDEIFDNEMNKLIASTQSAYENMRFREVLKHGFFDLQSLKDDYVVAKNGNLNPALLLRFIEVQLIVMSPIIPHFTEYMWTEIFVPKWKEVSEEPRSGLIIDARYPKVSKPYNDILGRINEYFWQLKRNLRLSLDKLKHGKKGKKGKEETKEIKHCILFVAKEFVDVQKRVLEALNEFKISDAGDFEGDYISALRKALTPQEQKLAMKFAAFVKDDVKQRGAEALELKTPFDEVKLLTENKSFVSLPELETFEIRYSDEECDIEGAKQVKESATPGKPGAHFY